MRIHLNKSILKWGFLYERSINRRTCHKLSTIYNRYRRYSKRCSKKFGVSKSTVHKDVSERLLHINRVLAIDVRKVLDENKAERHIRGGMATKLKYEKEHKK